MFKNVAAKFYVFAFDATTNVPKTGDAANITAYVAKDYGAATVLADTAAAEVDATNAPGYYIFDAAQGETNADCLLITAKSATSNIKVIGAPAIIYTRPTTGWLAPATAGRTLVVDANGLADANTVKIGPTGSGTAQTAKDVGAAVPAAAAGASGGLLISGSNSGTTTFGALTVTGATTLTGNVSMAAGLTITQSSANTSAVIITGTGTGHGIAATGGATGHGILGTGGGTQGDGIKGLGTSAGYGINATGGATGIGLRIIGGSSSGDGVYISTTSGVGFDVIATAGHGASISGNGTSKHGILVTGGTAGTSDGMKLVAGTGGVSLNAATTTAAITGNITGDLSGSVGSVTGAVGSVTGLTAATVHSDLDDIQARLPAALTAGGNIKADSLAISGSTAAADALEESTEAIAYGTVDGTGATTTVFLSSALTPDSSVNDQFNGRVMIFKNDTTTAALRGQATTISDYAHTSAEIGTFTVVALTTAPATGDTFAIL